MMPRNPLLIGNSHTAALRIALRDDPGRWPGFQPAVSAMPGGTLGELELRGEALHPITDNARKQMRFYNRAACLPLRDHDGFVVVGGLSFAAIARSQDSHRSLDFPSMGRGVTCQLVSTGFADALIRYRIEHSPALRLIRFLAGLKQGPVLFLDTVFPSSDCRDDPQGFAAHVAMAERGDGAAYHGRYLRVLHEVLGSDACHVPQPGRTVVDAVFTAPEWMRGSLRMNPHRDVAHEPREYGHANAACGALQIDAILAAFAGL